MKLAVDNKLWVPDNDFFFYSRPSYESNCYKRVLRHLDSKRLGVDVGAHVGLWTMRMAQDFENVEAFEPIPDHLECLLKNTGNMSNVKVEGVGLSSTEAEMDFIQVLGNSGQSMIKGNSNYPRNSLELKLKVKSLDEFNLSEVDLIKLDVEGHEEMVLEGAKSTISEWHPLIVAEIWSENYSDSKVFELLGQFGYSQIDKVNNNFIFKNLS